MDLWTDDNFAQLGDAQRRSVERRSTKADGAPTPAAFLNSLGAGVAVVNAWVEEDRASFNSQLGEAGRGLYDGGVNSDEIIALALAYAKAGAAQRASIRDFITAQLTPPPAAA